MLEIAQNIHVAGDKKLSSAMTLTNGSIGLSYTSNDVVTAGRNGDLTVPSRLKLELPVFDGTDLTHEVQVRLRVASVLIRGPSCRATPDRPTARFLSAPVTAAGRFPWPEWRIPLH